MDTEHEIDAESYLQDPDMFQDRLPQPYRMIEHVLNDLIEDAWEKIIEREAARERELAAVKIPESTSGEAIGGDDWGHMYGGMCYGKDVLFIGNNSSVLAIKSKASEDRNEDEDDEETAKDPLEMQLKSEIQGLAVVHRSEMDIIVAQLASEVVILAYIGINFVELTEITQQFLKDMSTTIVETTISPTCSHLGITFACSPLEEEEEEEGGGGEEIIKLGVYSLPLEAWISEVKHIKEGRRSSSSGQPQRHSSQMQKRQSVKQSSNPGVPVLLYVLSPPSPLTPCVGNPSTVFHSVCDQRNNSLPSGQLHCLSHLYFENRRRLFTSKRQHFVSKDANITNYSKSQPTYHFLYYKSPQKEASPCDIAVWWEGHFQLILYPVVSGDTSKQVTPPPSRLLPQASLIVSSCITSDSSMLALGLKSGVVIIWNMKIGMCSRVVSCVNTADTISALEFLQFSPSFTSSDLMLGVGTELGKVLVVSTEMDSNDPAICISSRTHNQKKQEVCDDTLNSSGNDINSRVLSFKMNPFLPSLLTTVHVNGSFVLWNPTQQEALYIFSLDMGYSVLSPKYCTFSDDGHNLLVAGKYVSGEMNACRLIQFNLWSKPLISSHWMECPFPGANNSTDEIEEQNNRKKESSLLNGVETHLMNYLKLRYSELDEKSEVELTESSNELPNILIEQP